ATVLEPPTEDISTMAADRQTGTHTAALGETVFVDTVRYTGLVVGKEYTLNATLMNKDTKEPVKVDGKEITGSVTFTVGDLNFIQGLRHKT
ncbi:MAG: VaFE repeat-containing surface-anchored protein, partial [Eubacterium sp.]|nr:VaFE repeat-containing surface-anchored protein [Eubacterium sp.]